MEGHFETGGEAVTRGFGLIESWEILRRSRGGRMISVTVTLSEWLYRAVCARSVLTLSRDYFRLRKPLERRVYELARKHCGRQAEWAISIPTLHLKTGSAAPVRVFRAALRKMIASDHLPEYSLAECEGDILVITRRAKPRPTNAPILREETLEAAKALKPGLDVYGLQARWLTWWDETGRVRLKSPDAAFLAWVKKQREG